MKDVANATTEPSGEVTFLQRRLANAKESHFKLWKVERLNITGMY